MGGRKEEDDGGPSPAVADLRRSFWTVEQRRPSRSGGGWANVGWRGEKGVRDEVGEKIRQNGSGFGPFLFYFSFFFFNAMGGSRSHGRGERKIRFMTPLAKISF